MKNKKIKKKRPLWFRGLKNFMKLFIKEPNFVYLGDKVKDGSLILSNHVGTSAPLALELYWKHPFRFWGAWQMNSNVINLYKYLSKDFYHEKKHWNLFGARMFCIIAAPLTWIFYRGLRLISTFKDSRFRNTLKDSVETIKAGQSVVIFPEDSSTGYHDKLEGFLGGFVVFGKYCMKHGIDLPVHLAYFRKSDRTYIIDKSVMFSNFMKDNLTEAEITKLLCDRVNELSITEVNEIADITEECLEESNAGEEIK